MMPPLRSFDDLDGKERGQKKTDDLRAMTTLGPRTLILARSNFDHYARDCRECEFGILKKKENKKKQQENSFGCVFD